MCRRPINFSGGNTGRDGVCEFVPNGFEDTANAPSLGMNLRIVARTVKSTESARLAATYEEVGFPCVATCTITPRKPSRW